MNAVEDIATTIAASVRAHGWGSAAIGDCVAICTPFGNTFCVIYCKDESQAKRLAEMMSKPAEPVFEAMGLSPFPTFPTVTKS